MANSIKTNKDFRAALTRKGGATGAELQAITGRAYVYSTWSLRCMETETKELWTQKEGRETRYMLRNRNAGVAKANANVKPQKEAANANVKVKTVRKPRAGKPVTDQDNVASA